MSEFYKLRRSKITDALALLGFVIGFIAPVYEAAQHLVTGFENPGQEAQGLGAFALRVLVNAFTGGAAGLVAGIAIGWIWERIHKLTRPRHGVIAQPVAGGGRVAASSGDRARSPLPSARDVSPFSESRTSESDISPDALPDASIRFDNGGFGVSEFLALTRKVVPGEYDVARTTAALEKTINIGAWDGERLVGAVRVLSDGYLYSTIPEVVVDPEYRRQGIGRELMMRALDLSATGVVLFGSPPESAGFFERLGCQRAPSGYVLRRKKAATVRVR